jgi:hypothetical protein
MKRIISLIVFSVFLASTTQAQFLKKLKDKVSQGNAGKSSEYYKDDQGITGELHEEFMGQIVFSQTPLSFGEFRASDFVQNYEMGETLYFRAFFPKCMYNMAVDHYGDDMFSLGDIGITVKYYINDVLTFEKFQPTLADIDFSAMKEWTTLRGVVVHPTEDYQILQWTFKDFIIAHPELFQGEKEYKMGISLTLATEDDDQTVDGLATLFETSGVGLPKPKTQNPELEQRALTALKDHASDQGWQEVYHEVILTSRDWTVLRNELSGQIIGRIMEIAAVGTWPSGNCQYKYYDIFQNYIGNDFKGDIMIRSVGAGYDIPCKLIK